MQSQLPLVLLVVVTPLVVVDSPLLKQLDIVQELVM